MNPIKKLFDNIHPYVEEGGKFHAFRSLVDGFETFAFVPNTTSRVGSVNIHDAIDSKRIMSFVVIALLPALFFGMYNVGYQNALATGHLADATFWGMFWYGFLAVLPKIIVSYVVGLGIEFTVAQWKNEEIQEGFLVSGIIIPMIVPVTCPLWMLAIAVAFSVILAKEIFGGTGMNIFNPALITRAFLFFSYPSAMTGDATVWVAQDTIFGLGYKATDACTWKTMLSVFVGGAATGYLMQALGLTQIQWYEQLVLGGFAFGAVFMATDPVTSCRTECGKYVYGLLIGFIAVLVRVLNPGYPEGMMLAILLMNLFASLIDYCFVQSNINMRAKRVSNKK